jgi:hypothetical protein
LRLGARPPFPRGLKAGQAFQAGKSVQKPAKIEKKSTKSEKMWKKHGFSIDFAPPEAAW